jgi:hypothetical protein
LAGEVEEAAATHVFRHVIAAESQLMAQAPAADVCGSNCGGGRTGAV